MFQSLRHVDVLEIVTPLQDITGLPNNILPFMPM
jgi:hypothetical protein